MFKPNPQLINREMQPSFCDDVPRRVMKKTVYPRNNQYITGNAKPIQGLPKPIADRLDGHKMITDPLAKL